MRMQRLTTDGEGPRSDGDSQLDQYIDQCLEYLDGERPEPPSPEGLSAEERAEADGILRVFGLHWGSRAAEAATPQEAPAATKPDIFVACHGADRGWASWITFELENVGYRCAASVVDPTTDVDVPGWAADTRVLTVVSTCSLATADAWPALQLSPRQPDDRVILVRVDDCEMHGLGPSRWVDLAGRTEGAARQALLQGVAGQQPAEDHASGQRFGSPLELWLQRLGGELGSPTDSLLLSLCVLTHPDQDHLKAGTPVRGLAELHAPSERGEEPWVPRLMRETLRDRLSPETRDRCADLAADLAGLAEVNAKLSSFAKARFYSVQASAILALVRGQEEPSPEPPAGRPGSCRSPSCRPWREIAGCS